VHLDRRRQVAAARLAPASDELTILYADGGTTSSTEIDSETAKKTVTELGLLLGGTSDDGVRHWWR
jgi:heptaprenylglyceryl phosphate synthase